MHTFAQKPKAAQQTTSAKSAITGRGHFGHSPEVRSIFHLQRTIGNQAVQRMLKTDAVEPEVKSTGPVTPRFGHDFSRIPIHSPAAGAIQTKLAINEPGDSYEQEADRVADMVMRMPEPTVQRECATCGGKSLTGGECPECTKKKQGLGGTLQRLSTHRDSAAGMAAPPIVSQVLSSSGQPLPADTRAFMEQRFGHDFSRVRVHADAAAEQSARDVNAHAYTVGHNIVFGAGQFAPGTSAGRRLMAHELTHVVQQSGSEGSRAGRGVGPGDPAVVLQRAPDKPKPETDPRGTPGHRDPLFKVPEAGQPVVEVMTEGARSVSWSWEVERPGTPATGGKPFRQQVYWARFEVDAQGVMRASARMVSPSGQFRVPEATLRAKFKEALGVFRLAGVRVVAFEAEWGYMGRGEISGNLDAFFGQLRRNPGMSLVDAARGTPSGQAAVENGFTEVSTPDVGYDPNQEHLQSKSKTVPTHGGEVEVNRPRQVRPVVRVRFAVPGTTFPDAAPAGKTSPTSKPSPTSTTPTTKPTATVPAVGVKPPAGFGKFAVGVGKSFVVNTLVTAVIIGGIKLAWAWITREKNVRSDEERRLGKLFTEKVTPGVEAAMKTHARKAEEMTNNAPEFPVYANVTVDLKEEWWESGIAGNPTDRNLADASFVDLDVSFKKVSKEATVDSGRYGGTHYETKRVTYSVEIDFGETPAERHQRVLSHWAAEAINKGLTARLVAEGMHWGTKELTSQEKRDDEQRRNWGDDTLAEQRAYDEREQFVLAYIELAKHHSSDEQWADAWAYLSEIRRRPRPIPGTILRPPRATGCPSGGCHRP